jgi:hypothetical protein
VRRRTFVFDELVKKAALAGGGVADHQELEQEI